MMHDNGGFRGATNNGLTPAAADTATPRANVGEFSAKNRAPTGFVGRRRRAADALVGRHNAKVRKGTVKR